ncbi:MAG: DNA methyltransferase [Acidobacteriota bacterium]|nr:DNA methyltransferase [Acidobacteriota bacterium]
MAKQAKTRTKSAEPRNLDELKFDPKNARRHPERNLAMIEAALADVGAARSIVIDEDGCVLAGEGVSRAAGRLGLTKLRIIDVDGDELVAVRRRGLTPDQKTRLSFFDNRAGELAEWDTALLQEFVSQGVDLSALWTEREFEELLRALPMAGGRTDPDQVPAPRSTTVRLGDLFQLGSHRLLCGDATNPSAVAALLDGVTPGLMVTDPPYGVEYDPSWRAKAGLNKNTQKQGTVLNDDRADWTEAWRLFPGDACYVWHAGLKSSIVEGSLQRAGFTLRAQIIWAKDRLALSRGDYHWQHEPCWYGVRDGETSRRTSDRTQTTLWRVAEPGVEPAIGEATSTVWEIASREDGGHGHGTQKPVECMARPIRNHLPTDVYEPFSGSGSTLIAGEQLGRRIFANELNPTYVQVAIDRWEAFTGGSARRLRRNVL